MPLNLIFTQPGNFTIEDNGIPGDNTSVIKDGTGTVIFTFIHPADVLGFTVSTPGVNLTINLTDSLGAANLTVGSLTDPAATPDSITINKVQTTGIVTLVSNGAITERGSDAGADIIAGQVILSAGTGVGTAGNALETQTSAIEGETVTGGINLSNFGSVQIGGISADVEGLDVTTSGNLTFTNFGSIFLSDDTGFESVHGGSTSGNVTLLANGFDADIIANVDTDAISTPAGNITLQAGRDVGFGVIGANFDNDVRAFGSITINAGRDFLVDGFADISSDDTGGATGGNVNITTGRNIHVRNVAGTDGSIFANGNAGGDVILTTGINGALIVDPASIGSAQPIASNSGDLIINADRMLIAATSGIGAANGQIAIRPVTIGREIILGSAGDAAFALELSNTEAGRIFTPTLTLGNGNTGAVSAVGAFGPANVTNLTLVSGTDITLGSAMTVGGILTLHAGDDVHFLSTSATTVGSLTVRVDQAGDDGGVGGLNTFAGALTAGAGVIIGNAEADTLNGTGGDDTINGLGGNDTIDGGEGIDTINGGDGDDTLHGGGNATDELVHGDEGNDTITSTGEGQYFGDGGNDTIFGGLSTGAVPEVLDGGSGIDTLDTTSFSGSYNINLATGTTNFAYESFVNFENIVTGDGNDVIMGSSGANSITSGSGNDTLNGGTGNDTMSGGTGDDFYFVDSLGDVIVEAGGSGTDRIFTSVSYAMGAGVHVENFTTTNNAGTDAINLTGNELVNSIAGNNGNNILNGGVGADTLNGLGGDDWFFVDNAGDVVVEAPGGGTDRIFASVSYTMSAGVHVETFSTTNNAGTDAINLTGNELVNSIAGNNGNNVLNGGAGADTLNGLGGDDSFYVDQFGDVVIEAPGGGTDRIFASSNYAMGAGVHVETLSTTNNAGVNAINFAGNELANSIAGNNGANVLDGGGGSDTLNGLGGADTFRFTTALGAGNVDTIAGYVVADDTIQLDDAVFTGLAAGALAAGAFNTGAGATQADDRIIYNAATGALLFDADGTGGIAAIQFATLSPGLAMTASEFFVI